MTATEPREQRPQRRRRRPSPAARAARDGVRHVTKLTGRDPEGVVSLERTDDGWRVGVEVVEVHRIPDSADILAVYEADLDESFDLLSYRRTRRYPRGRGE